MSCKPWIGCVCVCNQKTKTTLPSRANHFQGSPGYKLTQMCKLSKRPIVLLIKAKRHFALESRFSFIFFCIFKSFWTVQRTDLFHLLFIINLSAYCFVSYYFYQNDKIKSQSLIYAWFELSILILKLYYTFHKSGLKWILMHIIPSFNHFVDWFTLQICLFI